MFIRVLLVSYIFVFCAVVFAGQMAIVNPGFEDPVIADGGFGYQDPNIPGWTIDKPSSVYRIYNPFDSYEIQPVEGNNFLYLAPAGASASLSQITTETILAEMVYEFSVSIGCLSAHFGDDTATDAYYVVALYTVDGAAQQVMYTSGAVAVESPSWRTLKVRFNSAANPTMVGKKIRIIFGGKMVMFDDVKIIYGSYKQLTIQVSPSDAGIDSVSPMVGTYPCYEGETVDLEAMGFMACPDVYTFTGWSGDVADAGLPMTTITMDGDKTITAGFVFDGRGCEQIDAGVSIANPGFEKPLVPDGGYQFATSLPGWNIDANDVTYTVYNSSSTFKATQGDNHIAFQLAGAGSGQISQIPAGTIQANTVYTFTFDVAAYSTAGYYQLSLYYAPRSVSHLLATTGASYLAATYQWNTISLVWDSTTHPELIGQSFEIILSGKKMFFDNFIVTPAGKWAAMMNLSISTAPAGLMDYVNPTVAQSQYQYGDTAKITAATEAIVCPDRYVFDGWIENGVELENGNSLVLPMNGDKVITAKYSIDPDFNPQCGSVCRPITDGDVNRDCEVNMYDFAALAEYWMQTAD